MMTQNTNPFTGLPGYAYGDATITALHNRAPVNGNWQWVVGFHGELLVFNSLPVAQAIAVDLEMGKTTVEQVRDQQAA